MNRILKLFFLIFFLFYHSNILANYAAIEPKIAIVDFENILEQSLAMREVRKSISEISSAIQIEMSSKELELKRFESELTKQRDLILPNEFEQQVAVFNQNVSRAKKLMQQRKTSLEKAHNKAIANINTTIVEIIAELAKSNDISLVLPSNQVLFAKENLNITPLVIDILNKKLKSVSIDYNP